MWSVVVRLFGWKYSIRGLDGKCTHFDCKTSMENFDFLLTVNVSIFISVSNQLDAQNLFYNRFYFMLLHVSSTCPPMFLSGAISVHSRTLHTILSSHLGLCFLSDLWLWRLRLNLSQFDHSSNICRKGKKLWSSSTNTFSTCCLPLSLTSKHSSQNFVSKYQHPYFHSQRDRHRGMK